MLRKELKATYFCSVSCTVLNNNHFNWSSLITVS